MMIGRRDMDASLFDPLAVIGMARRKVPLAIQDFRKHAGAVGRHMKRNEHAGWTPGREYPEPVESAPPRRQQRLLRR
jgi:hypothetical protein